MSGFLDKLNTLLRAQIDSFLEDDLRIPLGRNREALSSQRLGKNIDAEISTLRQRIDQALNEEDSLQAQIDMLRQEVADWDVRADNALLDEDESAARHAIAQMKRAEQQAALLEADMDAHRRSTAGLIERVNLLEGLVAEARSRQEAETAAEEAPQVTLDSVLQTARQEAETLAAEEQRLAASQQEIEAPSQAADDLAARRDRLTRRPPVQEE